METGKEYVNHPDHYKQGKLECFDVMVDVFGADAVMDFCILNAFKYIWRHKSKDGERDLRKAKWYLDAYLGLAIRKRVEAEFRSVPETVPEDNSTITMMPNRG